MKSKALVMGKNLLILALVMSSFFSHAQSFEIERLRKEVKEHPQQDTVRVNRLNEICNTFPSVATAEMGKFADEALFISRKLKYARGEGYALIGKARSIYLPGDKQGGAALLQEADSIAKKIGDAVLQLWVLIRLSGCYLDYDYKRGLSYALEAEELAQRTGNKTLLSQSQQFAASCYNGLGDYAKGMEYAMKGLKTGEEANCSECLALAWSRIAATYTYVGDYERSNEYYQKLYDAYKQLGYDQANSAQIVNNIGENYRLMGKYPEALQHYKLELQMDTSLFIKEGAESNIADVYVRTDSLALAFQYAFSALATAKKLDDTFIEAWVDGILSRAYLKMKMPDSASYYARRGLALSEKTGVVEFMRDNTLALANAYAFKKDFENAYHYHNLYINYQDSILNNETKNKTAVLEKNYEIEKKEGQIALLSQQKKAQQNSLVAVSTGLLLILISAILLLRSNRQKQKAKVKIEKAYTELKTAQAQLIQSEKMASLGTLTAGIAHEIQNPLNFVNNFSEVNEELVDDLKAELVRLGSVAGAGNIESAKEIADSIKENQQKINLHGKRADSIVKGMLQHSRASSGHKELTDINALCDEYLRLAYHGLRAKDKSFNAETKTDFDISIGKIDIVPQEMGRVILNLINNAFYAMKAANPVKGENYEPMVTLSTHKSGSTILISVKDNGVGIPDSVKEKIFQPFFTTKPTGQGTGLGLSLAYDIIKAHGGEIKVWTEEGKGTEFVIQLPVTPTSL